MNLTGIAQSEVRGAPFEKYYNDRIIDEGTIVVLTKMTMKKLNCMDISSLLSLMDCHSSK